MNRARVLFPTIVVAALACGQGCGGGDKAPDAPSNTMDSPAPPMSTTPPTALNNNPGPMSDAPVGTAPAKPMTMSDSEILAVAQTAHGGEIDEAKLVEAKTKNAKVKSYAKMIQKHHGDARDQGDKLAKKLSLSPQDTALTADMKGKSKDELATLQGKSGTDLDRAYLDHQVKEHEEVLQTLDEKLLPNAKSPELKQMLADLRPTLVSHLDEAKKIQATLPMK